MERILKNRMRLYLLGELDDSEATSVEQEFFSDDEKFEQMWELENSLVESYVRGRLSPGVRKRFESNYLASPVHRRRVAVARNLILKAAQSRAEAPVAPSGLPLAVKLFQKLGISPEIRRFALAAAALLLTLGSFWLVTDRIQRRNEVAPLKAQSEALLSRQQELADQIAATTGEKEELLAQLERLRAERRAIEQNLAQPDSTPRPAVFSALLSPVHIRGGGDPHVFTIPRSTSVVRLQMKADWDGTTHFQVALRSTEGGPVWRQQTIKPHIDGGNAIITINVPANKLRLGDYILTLSAVMPTGDTEEINSYFFRVIRK